MMMEYSSKWGFTLIELMIVIVIVGLLAAIAIPNYVRVVNNTREAEVESNMHSVQFEVELYMVDYRRYPDDASVIAARLPGNIKNPFDENNDVVQNLGESNIEGVVEYDVSNDFENYTITGLGKGAESLPITLYSGY